MNILIISQYYYPEQFQINEIAPALVKRGHKVTVLTGLPNYPQGEIYDGYSGKERRYEIIDGVRVIRVKEHPRRHGVFHLIWNYISFARNGNHAAKRLAEHFDIVFCYQLSPVTCLYPAVTYKKKHQIPLLAYCLDIWPESAKAHVKSETGIIYRIVSAISRKLYQQCDHIAVTSRPFIEYLAKQNDVQPENTSYIPQHADSSMLAVDLASEDNGIADFMYAGNLGQGQKVDVILRAAAEINSNDYMIHIVGDGSCRSELEKLSHELDIWDHVKFYGNQNRDQMPGFYKKADALLITLRGDNEVSNTMPGKLLTYMTCRKPIFGAINGAAQEIITESGCGECTNAENYKELACIMNHFIFHPEEYALCGEKAGIYFKAHFTLATYLDSIEKTLKELTDEF